MNFLESIRFGVRGLAANKMRSSLTTLGILIGVASVIILIAVGNGSSKAIQKNIERLGTNTITIRSGAGGGGGGIYVNGTAGAGNNGGGNGASNSIAGSNGLINSGSGGGGAYSPTYGTGYSGGSGIIIVRYAK